MESFKIGTLLEKESEKTSFSQILSTWMTLIPSYQKINVLVLVCFVAGFWEFPLNNLNHYSLKCLYNVDLWFESKKSYSKTQNRERTKTSSIKIWNNIFKYTCVQGILSFGLVVGYKCNCKILPQKL